MANWAGVLVLSAAVSIAAAGCATTPTRPLSFHGQAFEPTWSTIRTAHIDEIDAGTVRPTSWTASHSSQPLSHDRFTLTSNADPISNFTPGSGTGAWFWNAARDGDYLFRLTPSAETKWRVPRTGHAEAEMPPGIAQADDGVVWLGIDQTVYSLNPETNRVVAWTLPSPTQDPAAAKFGPRHIPSAIDSLAISPSGRVAVAERLANEVTELDPTTGAITQIKMPNPKHDEPFSVAFSSKGVLAAGFGDFDPTSRVQNVLLISRGKARNVGLLRAGAGFAVTADGRQFFSGLNPAEIVDPRTDTSRLITTPSGLYANTEAPQTLLSHSGLYYAARSTAVIDFAPSATKVTTIWPVPNDTYTCGPFTGPIPPTTTASPPTPTATPTTTPSPTPQTCRYQIEFYGVDGSGNVWVVTSAHNNGTVDLLNPHS